tara:strand:+ start:767 stop:1807 length:1041 start_codon:yes stop_codon:yes gene_type:complete
MKDQPLRTTVIGSYPFPGWLEFACQNLQKFGKADREEMIDDAVIAAIHDQTKAGLDVITDGEQTRLDFNLSFYGYLEGIELESQSPRQFGPPAHDQRGKHKISSTIKATKGLGTVDDFNRLKRLNNSNSILKASVPGPYTLAGRLLTNQDHPDRLSITEKLIPIVRKELEDLVNAGCQEITVDEPSMSCYAHKENTKLFVEIFNQTVEPIVGKCRLSTHLCFGNYKGRAVGLRRYDSMFPAFLEFNVDELHLEMASREFSEIEILSEISKTKDVAVGIIDVKSYYIETPEDVAQHVHNCLKHAPADRLSLAPDCGLSQTARWAAKKKLQNMVKGVALVKKDLGIND